MSEPAEVFSPAALDDIARRLATNKRVRRALPDEGRVHIDRQLPFLCVYRQPASRPDPGTRDLVLGQAAYLVGSGARTSQEGLSALTTRIVQTLAELFGAFLLVEIWTAEAAHFSTLDDPAAPAFRLVQPRQSGLESTVQTLAARLARVQIDGHRAQVDLAVRRYPTPPGYSHLVPLDVHPQCYRLGIIVRPMYQDPDTGEVLPIVQRAIVSQTTRALQKGLYQFVRAQTPLRPPHYQALGRRALVKAVWGADRELADIDNAFDLLLSVSPTNNAEAWETFKAGRYARPPVLRYRPLNVDPDALKRRLWNLHLERIEDPTLEGLFQEKRLELDAQISLLLERNTPAFLHNSMRLYGRVSPEVAAEAEDILRHYPPLRNAPGTTLNARAFAQRARAELDHFAAQMPEVLPRVQVRRDVGSLMVSQGQVFINADLRIPADRLEALIQHEVGTHVLTYYNGMAQPFEQMRSGLAGYSALQEGLAVFAEYLVGGLTRERLRLLAGRVLAAQSVETGADFVQTFRLLHEAHGFGKKTAFRTAVRVHRGGGFNKDMIYLRGLRELLGYLANGGDLEALYVGKIATRHIAIIRELWHRKVLKPVQLKPSYIQTPVAQVHLQRAQAGLSVRDLIKEKF
ncbi:MAG: flavohemoglobin expression-modulating QEGLA motif protein [Anaerolineales bacterium]